MHTCFKMCVSPLSRPFVNWRIVSQLHPCPISPHPRLKMCILVQSRSHLNPTQVSRFVSPLQTGSQIHVFSLSQLNLTTIWVLIFTSHLHTVNISPPSSSTKLHLSSIQASSQTHTWFKMCVSPPSRSFLNWRIVSQLHPSPISPYPRLNICISPQTGPISTPSRQIHVSSLSQLNLTSIGLMIFASRLHPGNISSPPRSTKLHLSSIQASSQTHTGFKMCLTSIPVLSQLANCISSTLVPYHPIHVSRCASQLNPGPISTPSRSRDLCLLSTQAPMFTFLLCLSWILPQSGSRYLHLAYIQETSHLQPGPPTCILVLSKHHPKCIHVSRCVFTSIQVLCQVENCISAPSQSHITPSTSQDVHLSSIQVPSQPHPGLEICVSSPPRLPDSRFFFVPVESYLNPGPDIYISPTSS